MEEPTNKQGKRKTHIVVKGGNIGGLVVWGGVIVVGSLIAAFAVKKRRQTRSCDKKNCNYKGGSEQGLGSILQTKSASSQLNLCDKNQGATNIVESQVDSDSKDVILDQNSTPLINEVTQYYSDDHQRIDDLAKESIPLSEECAYEFSFPVLDASLSSEVGNGIEQNSGEDYMNRIEGIKEEKIVDDVKIIAQGMSKVHSVDAAHDYTARNEIGKLQKVVDAEKVTTLETPLIHSAVEMEKAVDAVMRTSPTNSDESEEEKMEAENQTVDADAENSDENLAPAEDIEVKDGELVDTSYAVAKNSSPLNSVSEGNDTRDGSPLKQNNEAKNSRELANDERVTAETASSMHSVNVAVDQEEVDVKADPVEDLQLMETNDASKHNVSPACSVEEEDESDGYLDNVEENEHESYTSDGGEASSEGTETSSAESNSAKIWSVESLDADLKDSAEKIMVESLDADQKDSAEKNMEDEGRSVVSKTSSLKVGKDDLQNWTTKKQVPSLLMENRRMHLTKWRSWGLSIPALLLLLSLLLALHKTLFSNLLYRSFFLPSSSEN